MKREKKSKITILFLGVTLLFAFMIYSGITLNFGIINEDNDFDKNIPKNAAFYAVSGQIIINNWTQANIDYAWINGAGTWGEPYVIENVIFDAQSVANCLYIRNSEDYFRIINCTFLNTSTSYSEDLNTFYAGIKLVNVSNALIQNNTFKESPIGLYSDEECKNVTIYDNYFNNSANAIYLMGGMFNITNNIMNRTGIRIPSGNAAETGYTAMTHIIESNTLEGKTIYYVVNQTTKISTDFFGSDTTPGQVLAVNVSYSSFSDLNIDCGLIGIQMLYCINNSITSNNFTSIINNINAKGVSIEGCHNITLSNNNIDNYYYGIKIYLSKGIRIINDNNISNNAYGIFGNEIQEVTDNNFTIVNNQFVNNFLYDINLADSENDLIQGNEFINSKGNFAAIQLDSAADCQIIGNDITTLYNRSKLSVAILLISCTDGVVSNNDVSNYKYGIRIGTSSTGNLVTLNEVINTSLCGIIIGDNSDNNVTENTVDTYSEYSIYCDNSDNIIISNNNVSNNNHTGIYVINSDYTEILYNNIENCSIFGIYLDRSANCKINYNNLSNNGICIGVHRLTCPNLEATGNSCTITDLDEEANGGTPPGIPGYELIFIIGIIGMTSFVILRRRKNQIKSY